MNERASEGVNEIVLKKVSGNIPHAQDNSKNNIHLGFKRKNSKWKNDWKCHGRKPLMAAKKNQ